MPRLLAAAILLLVLGGGLALYWRGVDPVASRLPAPPQAGGTDTDASGSALRSPVRTANPATSPGPAVQEIRSELLDGLNASGRDIQTDLKQLNELFNAWLTNFRSEGVPIGSNQEITAALTGKNALQFAFVPPDHPAINARGELCDRWGTPFRFHVLSRQQMEIRSAGPDRRFGTEDDAEWAPWPRNF